MDLNSYLSEPGFLGLVDLQDKSWVHLGFLIRIGVIVLLNCLLSEPGFAGLVDFQINGMNAIKAFPGYECHLGIPRRPRTTKDMRCLPKTLHTQFRGTETPHYNVQ